MGNVANKPASQDERPDPQDPLWHMRFVAIFLGVIAGVGLLATVLFAAFAASGGGWISANHIFAGVLWALALLAVGAILGFLFGVPKAAQRAEPANEMPSHMPNEGSDEPSQSAMTPARRSDRTTPPEEGLRSNTNLEEISDWLTKAIVGVGLVELKSLREPISRTAHIISASLGGSDGEYFGVGVAMIAFYAIVGFLFGYLESRTYLMLFFDDTQHRLRAMIAEISLLSRDRKKDFAILLRGQGKRPRKASSLALDSQPAAEVWDSDPHSGEFGGKSEANGRKLTATVEPALGPTDPACKVHLIVNSTDPTRLLQGTVTFYLHPTFDEPVVTVPINERGTAELDIVTWGWFTVGAEADDNTTRLELRLKDVPGGTAAFYLP
jgi:hypothetical protein